uniref:Uncharacterized protein n=1 Tax=Arundo donax TaxID=35708 RepID=A0A0A9BA16_ARUDO
MQRWPRFAFFLVCIIHNVSINRSKKKH